MKPLKKIPMLLLLLALMIAPACDTFEEVDLGEEPAPVFVKPIYSIDSIDGIVTDTTSNGIMWALCANGETGGDCSGGLTTDVIYSAAVLYCDSMTIGGYSDWRLPTIEELKTLTYENSLYTPSWFRSYDTLELQYWWSSYLENNIFVYALQLSSGLDTKSSVNDTGVKRYIRCVRAIQP